MSKVNNLMKEVSSSAKRVEKDLESFMKSYQSLSDLLKKKLREEMSYTGSYEGLDIFNALNTTTLKNLNSVKNAYHLIKRLRDLSDFNVSEIEEEIINADIRKLMK